MKNEYYTKFLLTIITICLLVLASEKIYQYSIPEAKASGQWICAGWVPSSGTNFDGKVQSIANSKGWGYLTFVEHNGRIFVCGR